MINNITTGDLRPQITVSKSIPSLKSISMPPILGFKTPQLKEKATIRVKKIKRGDNIIIPGEIDEDYVDIIEEEIKNPRGTTNVGSSGGSNFFISGELVLPTTKFSNVYCGFSGTDNDWLASET